MAILLTNSIFVHIPKTAGKWVSEAIINNVKGANFIGDPIYDAHKVSLDYNLPQFAFSRNPETWLHSLWKHRARKKLNNYGKRFNWQNKHKLERECKSYFFHIFFLKAALKKEIIKNYYDDFINQQNQISFGKQENLANELIRLLEKYNENFNKEGILVSSKKIINPTNRRTKKINIYKTNYIFRYFLERNNIEFYKSMKYPTLTIKKN